MSVIFGSELKPLREPVVLFNQIQPELLARALFLKNASKNKNEK
jgi:hypothetical protein